MCEFERELGVAVAKRLAAITGEVEPDEDLAQSDGEDGQEGE